MPTYENGTVGHSNHSETLQTALKAVREGLAEPGIDRSVFSGVAIFADYTTDSSEWSTYEKL